MIDISYIKNLIEDNEKVAKLKSEGFYLSSIMSISKTLEDTPHSYTINFYNTEKNEIASFSVNESGLEFTDLSPPMKDVKIVPLEVEKVKVDLEEAIRNCGKAADPVAVSRVVYVLRTSMNFKSENGPCWQINIFLKNFQSISILVDAESGEKIASTQSSLSTKLK